jgi:hypothetical protein
MAKKECFGCYYGVREFSYFLHGGKFFVLETDHRNLLWMEQSTSAIVIRWRMFLQGFSFMLRDIPGKLNKTADWLSRMYTPEDHPQSVKELLQDTPEHIDYYLTRVHGGTSDSSEPHWGAQRTWKELNDRFPGHRIPFRFVVDFIASCPTCQKTRLGMKGYSIVPSTRNLKVPHSRSRVGIDRLAVSPPSRNGSNNVIVIVEAFTSYTSLLAAKDYTAETLASCLLQYIARNGLFEELISDPGSDLMSEVVRLLHSWVGTKHLVSLVDRHESCGVERRNQEVLRHLRAIVYDKRLEERWDEPLVLCVLEYHMNDSVSAETGVRPFDAKFGSHAGTYFRLPPELPEHLSSSAFLKLVDADLKLIHEIVSSTNAKVVQTRRGNETEATQNHFQPGDFVLHLLPDRPKLKHHWYGPLVVIHQRHNDVEARHLATGLVGTYHVSRLKLFVGDQAQARDAAMRDQDQYSIDVVLNYQGNPLRRSETRYYVRFKDSDTRWLTYTRDLFETVQFNDFVSTRPELSILNLPAASVSKFITYVKSQSIADLHLPDPSGRRPTRAWMSPIALGTTAYVDLRFWSDDGHNWYFELGLPHVLTAIYVVPIIYTTWGSRQRTVFFDCELFNYSDSFDAYQAFAYGSWTVFNPSTMRLVDEALVCEFPEILPPDSRQSLLRKYRSSSKGTKKKSSVA